MKGTDRYGSGQIAKSSICAGKGRCPCKTLEPSHKKRLVIISIDKKDLRPVAVFLPHHQFCTYFYHNRILECHSYFILSTAVKNAFIKHAKSCYKVSPSEMS